MNGPQNNWEDLSSVRLTEYSRGAGCGCKIAPKVLDDILRSGLDFPPDKNLLVGFDKKDDAAVYDLQNGMAIISTTDFFTPIVDDAFVFGKIAAANAISDVYAMGGQPILAIAILGWPVEKINTAVAQKVVEGGRTICAEAGIPLAGGHSIDSEEPIFGLAVTGQVALENLKRNHTVQPGDFLFLTKPLGVGILATAQKRGLLKPEHLPVLTEQMTQLNSIGIELGKIAGVTAMTDVTGFGLLGHLMEMVEASGCGAEIEYSQLPVITGAREYIAQRIFPDATTRNWNAYSEKVQFEKSGKKSPPGQGVNVMEAFTLLPDPQTNGGLLVSVNKDSLEGVRKLLQDNGLAAFAKPIGRIVEKKEKTVRVQ